MIVSSVVHLAKKLQPVVRKGWEKHDEAVRSLTPQPSYKLAYANIQTEHDKPANIFSKAIDFVNKMTAEPSFMTPKEVEETAQVLEAKMEEKQIEIFDVQEEAAKGDKSAEARLNVLNSEYEGLQAQHSELELKL